MEQRKDHKHLLLLSYFIIYLIWFSVVEESVTKHFHVIHTPLDDLIPFCEFFIIPYILWFGYVAFGVLYFAFHDKKEYYRLCAFLFTGMTIFLIISSVYPNGHYLRPTHFTRDNFCITLCKFIYSQDTATNLFPSIHVYNSLGIWFAILHSELFHNKRLINWISGIFSFSIILSTMFVKQHSTFDVITAFLLAFFMEKIVYELPNSPHYATFIQN